MEWWQTAIVAFVSASFGGLLPIIGEFYRSRRASEQEARIFNRDFQREVLTQLQIAVIKYSGSAQDAGLAQGAGKQVGTALSGRIWSEAMDVFMLSERLASDEIRRLCNELFEVAAPLYRSELDQEEATERRYTVQTTTDVLLTAIGERFRELFGRSLV